MPQEIPKITQRNLETVFAWHIFPEGLSQHLAKLIKLLSAYESLYTDFRGDEPTEYEKEQLFALFALASEDDAVLKEIIAITSKITKLLVLHLRHLHESFQKNHLAKYKASYNPTSAEEQFLEQKSRLKQEIVKIKKHLLSKKHGLSAQILDEILVTSFSILHVGINDISCVERSGTVRDPFIHLVLQLQHWLEYKTPQGASLPSSDTKSLCEDIDKREEFTVQERISWMSTKRNNSVHFSITTLPQHPIFFAKYTLSCSDVRDDLAVFFLNRHTGEFSHETFPFIPLSIIFSIANLAEVYDALCKSAKHHLEENIKNIHQTEQAQKLLQEQRAREEQEELLALEQAQPLDIIDHIEEDREKNAESSEKNGPLSWDNIALGKIKWSSCINAFRRCGVEIVVTRKNHILLKYQGKVSGLPGRHDNNTEKLKGYVLRALKELSIPRETFFENL